LRRWHPRANGTVNAPAASPNGQRIYVGGSFTRLSGAHLAKLSGGRTGKVQPWKHHPTYPLWKVIRTRHTVYV
jgi:hypothetical protein